NLSYLPVRTKKNSENLVTPSADLLKTQQKGNATLPVRFRQRLPPRMFLYASSGATLHVENLRTLDGSYRYPSGCAGCALQGSGRRPRGRIVGNDSPPGGRCSQHTTPAVLR